MEQVSQRRWKEVRDRPLLMGVRSESASPARMMPCEFSAANLTYPLERMIYGKDRPP